MKIRKVTDKGKLACCNCNRIATERFDNKPYCQKCVPKERSLVEILGKDIRLK